MKKREVFHILLTSHSRQLASKVEILLKDALPGQINFHWARSEREGIQYALRHQTDLIFMDEPPHGKQMEKTLKWLRGDTQIPVIALCPYGKGTQSPMDLLKAGFSDLLPKKELSAELLKHSITVNLAREALRAKNKDLQIPMGEESKSELAAICQNIPMGVWRYDFENKKIEISRNMQAALNLHQSIYQLEFADFERLAQPQDQKNIADFFSEQRDDDKWALFFRLASDQENSKPKRMLLLAAPNLAKNKSEKDFLIGLQIPLPEDKTIGAGVDRVQEIGEWFLTSALKTLKNISGAASLPIFKQITRIQEQATLGKAVLKEFKEISTLVDIYVSTSNDLMAHYILTRGIPSVGTLPFAIEDITSLLEAYFRKRCSSTGIKPEIKNLGNTDNVIIGSPGFIGFLFYNMIKALLKSAKPKTTALFQHEHKKLNNQSDMIACSFVMEAETKPLHPNDLKLLNSIKDAEELSRLCEKNKDQILNLTSFAIGAFSLRKAGNTIEFKQDKKGRLQIICRLYAPTLESLDAKYDIPVNNILLAEHYAPHQLLIQNNLINIFPHAYTDVFHSMKEAIHALRNKQYQLLFVYSSAIAFEYVTEWLKARGPESPPLVFLYEKYNKEEEQVANQYEQTYYLPKNFSAKDLEPVITFKNVNLLH